MKNLVRTLQEIFTPPKMSEDELRLSGQGFNIESDLIFDERKESYEDYRKRVRERREEHNRDNEIELQIANFYVQRQALQKTLNISYGSLVISSFAVVVALLAVVVSLASH